MNHPAKSPGRKGVCAAECMHVLPRLENEAGSAYAYRVLSYNILMMYMPPGSWIREASIAEKLDLSRMPVHTAINLLADEHLVDVVPQSATHVSRINLPILYQSCFLRNIVEPEIFYDVSGNISDKDLAHLKRNVLLQKEAIDRQYSEADYIWLDNEFHGLVYRAAHKDYIWELVGKSAITLNRARNIAILFGYDKPRIDEHVKLLKILEEGNASKKDIETLLASHLAAFIDNIHQLIEDFPEYFTEEEPPHSHYVLGSMPILREAGSAGRSCAVPFVQDRIKLPRFKN